MEIIIARHGKTNLNKDKRLSGNSNTAQLVDEGKQHAQNLVELFSKDGIEAIFSSPLDRAVETASPIGKALNIEIQTDDLLREFDFGKLDGEPEQEGESAEALKKRREDMDFKFPEGESYGDVLNRVKEFLDKLLKKDLKKVLIVGHGGVNRCLVSALTKTKTLDLVSTKNTMVYLFNTEDNSIRWLDTLTNETGEGVLFRKHT